MTLQLLVVHFYELFVLWTNCTCWILGWPLDLQHPILT